MPYTYNFPRPGLTVDSVLFRQSAAGTQVLLIERKGQPYATCWALPGGFVDKDESLEDAARRELKEETDLDGMALQQLGAFGDPGRDPRGWTVTVAFWACVDDTQTAKAGDDAAAAAWWALDALPPLAFDHAEILQQAVDRASVNP